jgi:hypothetical protein
MITTTRIDEFDLEKLRGLAKSHRRSMTQELGALIDAAMGTWIENKASEIESAPHISDKIDRKYSIDAKIKDFGRLQKKGKKQ